MSLRSRLRKVALACIASSTVFVSCVDQEGGLNENERAAGNGDNGVSVGFGEIAIDPTGHYLISASKQQLVYGDLKSGSTRVLAGLSGTHRVAFDHDGRTIFVTRTSVEVLGSAKGDLTDLDAEVNLDVEVGLLARYDTESGKETWRRPVSLGFSFAGDTYPWLDVSEDDQRLVLTYENHVEVVNAVTGKLLHKTKRFASRIVDVDQTPDQKRLLITLDHEWNGDKPQTKVVLLELTGYTSLTLKVPNCADELVVTPNGKAALLAPTTCQPEPDVNKDPVSVIDLENDVFVRNLPGFGPAALAPNGDLAIAFIDMENVDAALFDDPKQIPNADVRYHLMLIKPETLTFDTVELGDVLPRYAVSPDGKLLLVDSPTLWDDGRIRVLDVDKRELFAVKGPNLRLNHYAMTRDSAQVFLLDDGLFRILLDTRTAEAAPLEFTPTHLNITPDDSMLVLRQSSTRLWLYDTQAGNVLRSLDLNR